MAGPADDNHHSYGDLPRILNELGVALLIAKPERIVLANEAFASLTGYSLAEILAATPIADFFARLTPELVDRGRRLQAGEDEPRHYEADLVHRDGHRVPVEIITHADVREGEIETVTIVRDLSERRRVESELAIRARQQAVVAELGRRALADPDVSSLMKAAVQVVAGTLDVEYAAVLEFPPKGDRLLLRAVVGEESLVDHAIVEAGLHSQAGYTLLTDAPVVMEDTSKETRFSLASLHAYHIKASVNVPIRSDDQPYGVLGIYTTRPRHFDIDDVHFLSAAANVLAVAIARARVDAELATRERQQAAVAELGRLALADPDLPSLMAATVGAVAGTLDVEYAKILELLPGGEDLLLRAGVGWTDGLVGRATVGAGLDSQAGYTLFTNGPVVVEDLSVETRFRGPRLLVEHEVVSGMSVIVVGPDRPWGVLGAHTTRRRHFSADDIHFLQAAANTVAEAIGRAGMVRALRATRDQERRLRQRLQAYARSAVEAQERERRHLARELHDEIGQTLTGLKLVLENYARLPQDAAYGQLDRAKDLVAELLWRVHDLSLDLRPAVLDDLGLRPALLWLVQRYSAQTGVEVVLECNELAERLRPEVETAAYRIVQEALTNVARHSGTIAATVSCDVTEGWLGIEVSDEGIGFEVDTLRPGDTSGLVGMEERARSTGGDLRVVAQPGLGTRIVAKLPLAGSPEAEP